MLLHNHFVSKSFSKETKILKHVTVLMLGTCDQKSITLTWGSAPLSVTSSCQFPPQPLYHSADLRRRLTGRFQLKGKRPTPLRRRTDCASRSQQGKWYVAPWWAVRKLARTFVIWCRQTSLMLVKTYFPKRQRSLLHSM